MQRIIAEQIDSGSGNIIGARTVQALAVDCRIGGSALGIIEATTPSGDLQLRVSAQPRDYQRARVYDDHDRLLESLSCRHGYVVHEMLQLPRESDREADPGRRGGD